MAVSTWPHGGQMLSSVGELAVIGLGTGSVQTRHEPKALGCIARNYRLTSRISEQERDRSTSNCRELVRNIPEDGNLKRKSRAQCERFCSCPP
jgi:hypothetical protein